MSDLEDEILALAGDVSENSKRSEQASEPEGSQSGSSEESRRVSGQKRKSRSSRSPSPDGEAGKDKRRRGSPGEYGPDLYRDRSDRERLGTLNELARERILADRAEKKQHHLDLHAVQQLFDPLDDKSKRSSRAKNSSKKSFSELKRRRAEKEQKTKSGSQSPELGEHVSSSNDEYEGGEKDSNDTQEDVTLQELRTIQVSRHMLVNWMFAPFLADAVVGCFVRLHIGDREDKQVYRLCEIEGVETTENKYYVDKTITNKVLRLRHADATKCWPMDIVSNQYVDQSEFERWLITMKYHNLELPSKDHISRKQEALNTAKEYILTEKDVENIVQQKKALRGEKKELTIEKSNLTTLKYFAEVRGDIKEAKELDTRIQEISKELTERDPTEDVWARINARNKKQNKEDARAAEQRRIELAKGIKRYVPHEIKKEPKVKNPKGEEFKDNEQTKRMCEFKKLIYISDIPLTLKKDPYWDYDREIEKVEAEYSIKYMQFRERIDSNRFSSFRELMQSNPSEQMSLLSAHML
ncbi:133_t:CDS:2 [Funneliformis mosseae]|uniref:133_t:CDS:1 n=1 Tax=Funneliformis mosseae TaxID=27381 RepID=A0A9N8VDQ4_FUNMO|nr:133_t:CDS:2 [Funneliformis mosseae]